MRKHHTPKDGPITPEQVRDYDAVSSYLDGLAEDHVRARGVIETLIAAHKIKFGSDFWGEFVMSDRARSVSMCQRLISKHSVVASEIKWPKAKSAGPDLSLARGPLSDAEEEWVAGLGFVRGDRVIPTVNTFAGTPKETVFSHMHHTGLLALGTGAARWFYHTGHRRWIHPSKILGELEQATGDERT